MPQRVSKGGLMEASTPASQHAIPSPLNHCYAVNHQSAHEPGATVRRGTHLLMSRSYVLIMSSTGMRQKGSSIWLATSSTHCTQETQGGGF